PARLREAHALSLPQDGSAGRSWGTEREARGEGVVIGALDGEDLGVVAIEGVGQQDVIDARAEFSGVFGVAEAEAAAREGAGQVAEVAPEDRALVGEVEVADDERGAIGAREPLT